jgi:hypothetical protein
MVAIGRVVNMVKIPIVSHSLLSIHLCLTVKLIKYHLLIHMLTKA